jgi:hypothetical protein
MKYARTRLSIVAVSLCLLVACATSQVQKARTGSVDVHSVLAAVDDAERSIYTSHTVPQWTDAKHQQFSQHLIVALKAGKALNEGVRSVPVSDGAKVNLATVSTELGTLTDLIVGVLPPDSKVAVSITAAKDAVLRLLPLFLE